MREDALIEALGYVIATRVFSADRHAFIQRGLAGAPNKRQEADRTAKATQLHDLEATTVAEPERAVDLLDALPNFEHVNITEAPERIQRKLYDALQLTIHYDRPDQARFRLVLTDDTINALAASAGSVTVEPIERAHEHGTPPRPPRSWPALPR